MPKKYVSQPRRTFLEMSPTNFVSSIRITPYHPLIRTRDNIKTCFQNVQIVIFLKMTFYILYFFKPAYILFVSYIVDGHTA